MLEARAAVVKLPTRFPRLDSAMTTSPTPPDQFAEINGCELRYRLSGPEEAPLAVIGHGIFSTLEQYTERAAALDLLTANYRVLLYDARGHGESEGPEEPAGYSWQTLGEEMLALASLAGEEHPILGGASMSASAALWTASNHPETPRALVLIMPPPLGPREERAQSEMEALQMLATLATAVESFGLSGTASMAESMPAFTATAGDQAVEMLRSQNPRTIVPIIRGLFESPSLDLDACAAISVPVVIFAHPDDPLHPVRSAHLLEQTIPDCRVYVGPERDYWRDHPDELARGINAFLESAR